MMHSKTKFKVRPLKIREVASFSLFIGLFFVLGGAAFTYLPYSSCLNEEAVILTTPSYFRYVRVSGAVKDPGLYRVASDAKIERVLSMVTPNKKADLSRLDPSVLIKNGRISVPSY